MLEILKKERHVVCGIASGNFAGIGWRKLELAGIAKFFGERIGGFGGNEVRRDALVAARRMAEER
jgi:hypothetical protein